MANRSKKYGSLGLFLLMVFSIVIGSIAFAGTAAATAEFDSFDSDTPVQSDETIYVSVTTDGQAAFYIVDNNGESQEFLGAPFGEPGEETSFQTEYSLDRFSNSNAANGQATLYVNDGNSASPDDYDDSVTFTIDGASPSIDFDATFDSQSDEVTVTVDSDEELSTDTLAASIDENDGSDVATLDDFEITNEDEHIYTTTYTESGDAESTYEVSLDTAEDLAGNDGAGATDQTAVDTMAPTATIDSPSDSVTNADALTFTADDANLESAAMTIQQTGDNGQYVDSDGNLQSGETSIDVTEVDELPLGSEGLDLDNDEYEVTLTAADEFGHESQDSKTFTRDTQAPTISDFEIANDDLTNDDVLSVSINANTLGGDDGDINVTIHGPGEESGTLNRGDFERNGGSYTATYDTSADGGYTATLETAKDEAGNDGASDQEDTVELDTGIDTATIQNPTADSPVTLNDDETLDVDYDVEDGNFDEATVELLDGDADSQASKAITDAGDRTAQIDLSGDGQDVSPGTYDVKLTVDDEAGNSKPVTETETVTIDGGGVEDVAINTDDTQHVQSGTNVTIDVDADDANFDDGTLEITDGETTIASQEITDGDTGIEKTLTVSDDASPGTYDVTLPVTDTAENSKTVTSEGLVVVDDTDPTIEAFDASFDAESNEVTITVRADEELSTDGVDAALTQSGAGDAAFDPDDVNLDKSAETIENNNNVTVSVDVKWLAEGDITGPESAVCEQLVGANEDVDLEPCDETYTYNYDKDEFEIDEFGDVAGVEAPSEFEEADGEYEYEATGEIDVAVDDNHTVALNAAEDLAGNDGTDDESEDVVIDTRPPNLENVEAESDGDEMAVTVESSEELDELSATVYPEDSLSDEDITGDYPEEEFDIDDFEPQEGDGEFEYTATYETPRDGEYSIEVGEMIDEAHNTLDASEVNSTGVDDSDPALIDAYVVDAELDGYDDVETQIVADFDEPIEALDKDDIIVDNGSVSVDGVDNTDAESGSVEITVSDADDFQTGDEPEIEFHTDSEDYEDGVEQVGDDTLDEDDNSTTIHSLKRPLFTGENFVSVPAESGTLDLDALDSDELDYDAVDAIWRYEDGEWETYDPDAKENDFDTMEGGEGYIISTTADTAMAVNVDTVLNDRIPTEQSLSEGWNLVGHYQEGSQAHDTAFASIADNHFRTLVQDIEPLYEGDSGYSYEDIGAGEEKVVPGNGYWVFVDDDEVYTGSPLESSGE